MISIHKKIVPSLSYTHDNLQSEQPESYSIRITYHMLKNYKNVGKHRCNINKPARRKYGRQTEAWHPLYVHLNLLLLLPRLLLLLVFRRRFLLVFSLSLLYNHTF